MPIGSPTWWATRHSARASTASGTSSSDAPSDGLVAHSDVRDRTGATVTRPTGWRVLGVVLACLTLLCACTTAGSPSATRSSAAAEPTLNGSTLSKFACSQLHHPNGPVASLAVGAVSGQPQRMILCGGGYDAVQAFRPGDADFAALVDALSLPDITVATPKSCPNAKTYTPAVIVKTTEGTWLVHEPVDQTSCRMFRPEVLKALDVATSGVGYLPDEPGTRLTVPTSNWTHGPIEGHFFGPLMAFGTCVVLGSRPPYSVVVWPRDWYARKWSSGEITVYDAHDKPYATTGRNVGLLGDLLHGRATNKHPCVDKFSAGWFGATIPSQG